MTKRKQNNSLYVHLVSAINQALPLEYAIRATRQLHPGELGRLLEIDGEIRDYWWELGASHEEIHAESLMDFAWDSIQIGFPLTRRHGRYYLNREFLDLIHQGLAEIPKKFAADVNQLNIPSLRYFRIFDLLNGNDILWLLSTTNRCLAESRRYKADDEIDLGKFALGVRTPVHIHPGLQYAVDYRTEGNRSIERFGILLDTEMGFSIPELKDQIREFLYQFAVRRQSLRPAGSYDKVSNELIQSFLEDELFGSYKITRLDGFIGPLIGLYCWDLANQYEQEGKKSPVNDAFKTAQQAPIRQMSYENIRKAHYTAKRIIDAMSFDSAAGIRPSARR